MAVSKINKIPYSGIFEITTIPVAGIEQINTIDVPSGFSTDYSIDLNGSSQYINLGSLSSTTIQPTQSSINSNGYSLACWIYIDSLSGGEYIFNIGA